MGTRDSVLILSLALCLLCLFSTGNGNEGANEDICKNSLGVKSDRAPVKSSNVDSYVIHGKRVRFNLRRKITIKTSGVPSTFLSICGMSTQNWVKELQREIDERVKVTKTHPPTSKESILPTPGKLAGNEEEKKPDTSSSGLIDDVKHTAASTPKTHEPTTEIVTPKAPEDPKTPTTVYIKTTKLLPPTTKEPIISTPGMLDEDKGEADQGTSSPGPTEDVKNVAASTTNTHESTTEIVIPKAPEDTRAPTTLYASLGSMDDAKNIETQNPKTNEPSAETITPKAPEETKTLTTVYGKSTKPFPPTTKKPIISTPGMLDEDKVEVEQDTSSPGPTEDVKNVAASTPNTHESTTEIVTLKAPEDTRAPTMVYATLGSVDGVKNIETQNPKTNEPSTETITPKAPEETRTLTMVYGKTTKQFPPTTKKPIISTPGMLDEDKVEVEQDTSSPGSTEDVKNVAASTPNTHESTTEVVTPKAPEDTRAPTTVYDTKPVSGVPTSLPSAPHLFSHQLPQINTGINLIKSTTAASVLSLKQDGKEIVNEGNKHRPVILAVIAIIGITVLLVSIMTYLLRKQKKGRAVQLELEEISTASSDENETARMISADLSLQKP